MEFVLSDSLLLLRRIEDNEMVHEVRALACLHLEPSLVAFSLARSTEEIFALFVSIAFLVDASAHVYHSEYTAAAAARCVASITILVLDRFRSELLDCCLQAVRRVLEAASAEPHHPGERHGRSARATMLTRFEPPLHLAHSRNRLAGHVSLQVQANTVLDLRETRTTRRLCIACLRHHHVANWKSSLQSNQS